MSTSTSDLPASVLMCRLCQSLLRDPRTLPCLHSFCCQCLYQVLTSPAHRAKESLPCPVCAQNISVPRDGVTGFLSNTFLQRMSREYVTEVQRGIATGRVPHSPPPHTIPTTHDSVSPSAILAARAAGPNAQFQYPGHLSSSMSPQARSSSSSSTSSTDVILQEARRLSSEMPMPSRGTGVERRLSSVPKDVVTAWESLQRRLVSVQSASLRATYCLETVAMAESAWHQRKIDLTRHVQRRSAQLQFYIKRQERLLLAALESRGTDDAFLTAAERGRAELRHNLKTLLHQTDVLKSVLDLATDAELTSLAPVLLASDVCLTPVILETPELAFVTSDEVALEDLVARDFGCLTSTLVTHTIFTPDDLGDDDDDFDEAFVTENNTVGEPSTAPMHCERVATVTSSTTHGQQNLLTQYKQQQQQRLQQQQQQQQQQQEPVSRKPNSTETTQFSSMKADEEDEEEFVTETYTIETPTTDSSNPNLAPNHVNSNIPDITGPTAAQQPHTTTLSHSSVYTNDVVREDRVNEVANVDNEDDEDEDEEVIVEETFEIIDGKMQLVSKRREAVPTKPANSQSRQTADQKTVTTQLGVHQTIQEGQSSGTEPAASAGQIRSTAASTTERGRATDIRRTANSTSQEISTIKEATPAQIMQTISVPQKGVSGSQPLASRYGVRGRADNETISQQTTVRESQQAEATTGVTEFQQIDATTDVTFSQRAGAIGLTGSQQAGATSVTGSQQTGATGVTGFQKARATKGVAEFQQTGATTGVTRSQESGATGVTQTHSSVSTSQRGDRETVRFSDQQQQAQHRQKTGTSLQYERGQQGKVTSSHTTQLPQPTLHGTAVVESGASHNTEAKSDQQTNVDKFQMLRQSQRQQRRQLLLNTSTYALPFHPLVAHLERRVHSLDRSSRQGDTARRSQSPVGHSEHSKRSYSPLSPKRRHGISVTAPVVHTPPRSSDSDDSVNSDTMVGIVSSGPPKHLAIAHPSMPQPNVGETSIIPTSITAPTDSTTSRPVRRAISAATDKASKMEYLRETWRRRKQLLIDNQAYFTAPTAKPEDDDGNLTATSPSAETTTAREMTTTISGTADVPKKRIKDSIRSKLTNLKQALKKNGKAEEGRTQHTTSIDAAASNNQSIYVRAMLDQNPPGRQDIEHLDQFGAVTGASEVEDDTRLLSPEEAAQQRVFKTVDNILQRKSNPTSPVPQPVGHDPQDLEGHDSHLLDPKGAAQSSVNDGVSGSSLSKPSLVVKPRVREQSTSALVKMGTPSLQPLQEDESKTASQPTTTSKRGLRVTSPTRDSDREMLQQVRANIRRKKERWRSLSLQ